MNPSILRPGTAEGIDALQAHPRLGSFYVRRGKRLIDVTTASIALVLLSPLLCLVALSVLMTLGPPVLLRQERVGRNGRSFPLLKVRTMRPDRRRSLDEFAGQERRVDHKSDRDPRHVPLGRVLRRFGLDELPQLWNVLRGDMSVVGPRPELVVVSQRHGLMDHPRHLVRPGLTGAWQVSNDRPGYVHEHVSYDEIYVRDISLGTDLRILLKTPPAMFRGR